VRKNRAWHTQEEAGAADKQDNRGKHGVMPADGVTSEEVWIQGKNERNKVQREHKSGQTEKNIKSLSQRL
jgi:hypothetical protein